MCYLSNYLKNTTFVLALGSLLAINTGPLNAQVNLEMVVLKDNIMGKPSGMAIYSTDTTYELYVAIPYQDLDGQAGRHIDKVDLSSLPSSASPIHWGKRFEGLALDGNKLYASDEQVSIIEIEDITADPPTVNPVPVASGLGQIYQMQLHTDPQTNVKWLYVVRTGDKIISRINLSDNNSLEPVVTGLSGFSVGVAVYQNELYFTAGSTIRRISLDTNFPVLEESTTVVASGLNGPRNLAFDDNGNLYIAEWGGNEIARVTDLASTPKLTRVSTDIQLNGPFGVLFHDDMMYVSERVGENIYRFELPSISCPPDIDVLAEDGKDSATVEYEDPSVPLGWQWTLDPGGIPSGDPFPMGTTLNTFSTADPNDPTLNDSCTCNVTVYVDEWEDVGELQIANLNSIADLALGNNDSPYIVAYEYDDNDASLSKGTVRRLNSTGTGTGTGWETLGNGGFSAEADNFDLELDSYDTPYVSYSNSNGYKVYVKKLNGSTWTLVGPAVSTGYVSISRLALSGNDTPYVAYNEGSIKVKKYDESSDEWLLVGGDGLSIGAVTDWHSLDLVLDNEIPYVAFQDADGQKATVMKFESGQWNYVGIQGFSDRTSNFHSLALDSNGVPYVAYRDESHGGKAVVKKYNAASGSWDDVGTASAEGFSEGLIRSMKLAIGSDDVPYVAYGDAQNFNKATVMKFDAASDSWNIVGTAGFSNPGPMALSSENVPYVAFADEDESDNTLATVMKFSVPVLSISDAPTVTEGDEAEFTLSLSHPINDDLTVDLALADGSALKDEDYELPQTLSATISKGLTTTTFKVETVDNTMEELTETFRIQITGATAAGRTISLEDTEGIATIIDNDNTATDFESFSLPGQVGDAIIDKTDHTIEIKVPYGTDLTSPLIASFELSQGAKAMVNGAAQTSGATPNNFSNTVEYLVTAQDGTTKELWTVSVSGAGQNDEGDGLPCAFQELASNNFTVIVTDATCAGKKNGSIVIVAGSSPELYTVYLGDDEEGVSLVDGSYTSPDLDPDEYEVCIGKAGSGCRQCYEVTVGSADGEVSGKIGTVNGHVERGGQAIVAVSLESGTAPYTVMVNGRAVASHSGKEFQVDARQGDLVEIATALPCEGTLTVLAGPVRTIVAHPNPVDSGLWLEGLGSEGSVTIGVHNLNGTLISQKVYNISHGKAYVPMEHLAPGIYVLNVESGQVRTVKVVKR